MRFRWFALSENVGGDEWRVLMMLEELDASVAVLQFGDEWSQRYDVGTYILVKGRILQESDQALYIRYYLQPK